MFCTFGLCICYGGVAISGFGVLGLTTIDLDPFEDPPGRDKVEGV